MGQNESQANPNAGSEGGTREQSFDQIMVKLQGLVERLERADLPLEDSLRAFEQGVELSRKGQSILDTAEQRVELLLQDGSTREVDPEQLSGGTAGGSQRGR